MNRVVVDVQDDALKLCFGDGQDAPRGQMLILARNAS
jgi:hypothetical protein